MHFSRKIVVTTLALLSMTWSGLCFAEESASNTQTMELDLKHFHFDYQEDIGDSETGVLNGVRIAYKSQNQDTKQYWRLLYEKTSQNTNYNGAIQNLIAGTTTPYQGTTNTNITTTEIILANPISDQKNAYVYTGYGYRSWGRNLTGSAGYLENYSWSYIPVGYRYEYKVNDKWDGAVDVAVRFMFGGGMDASGGGFDSQHVKLGNKPGFKAELPYTYKMNSQWSFVVTPWYEYSAISASNVVPLTAGGVQVVDNSNNPLYSQEPNSNTHQYGVDIGVNYKF